MKYLILFMFLSACTDVQYISIKEGDCVVNGRYELMKIHKVGSYNSYQVQKLSCKIVNWHSLAGGLTRTDCFKSFDHCENK